MRKSLQSQYKIKGPLTVFDMIDNAYDEDEEILLKAIVNVLKVYLESVHSDMNNTIDIIDSMVTMNE